MGKHTAKRFDSKEKNTIETENRTQKSFKIGKFIFTIFLFIIVIFIIPYIKNFFYSSIHEIKPNSSDNRASLDIQSDINAVSLSNILPENINNSVYPSKKFENTELSISNLFLNYDNNITVIEFDLCNEDLTEQDIFKFTFSLLDENGNIMISFDLSSEELLQPNQTKSFILIATRDVSNASDFSISIKR